MAGLCSDSGPNDEEENAGDCERAGNDFPLVGSFALLQEKFFGLDQLLLQKLLGFVVVKPSCLNLRTCRGKQDEQDDWCNECCFHKGERREPASTTGVDDWLLFRFWGVEVYFQRRHSLKNSQLAQVIPGEGMKSCRAMPSR